MKSQTAIAEPIECQEITKERLMQKEKVSIIISLFNCEIYLEELYNSLTACFQQMDRDYEIVFIDDGSDDNTFATAARLIRDERHAKLIRMRSRFGEASALTAGLKNSSGEVLIYYTARVRINTQNLSRLLTKLDQGNDLVVGWRYPRKDSRLNQIVSKIFNKITGKLSNIKLHDINSGVMVMKREVLDNIDIYGDLNNFIPVLAKRQGYKVTEEKIEQLPGKFRQSKYFREYLQRLLDILTVLFLTNYSKKPIHFLGFVGALFTLIGAGIELYLFVYRILQLGPIAGRPLLLLGALLLVIGIQLISIGLLGEMIIFTHAREIKEYNIEEIIETNNE